MNKTLSTLIRLHQFEVDECRRELKTLQEQEDALHAQKQAVADRLAAEKEMARQQPDYASAYSRFLAWSRQEQARLQDAVEQLQPALDAARDKLAEAFAEKKRVEISLDNRKAEQAAEEKRLEQNELDELAGNRFRRRRDTP